MRGRARLELVPVVPPRSRARRRDLCARVARRRIPIWTCSMFRSGRAPASAAASPRATRWASRREIVGVQSAEAPAYALSFAAGTSCAPTARDTRADGMATRVPDEDALADHSQGRRAHRARHATTKSPTRSAPIGPTRTISPKAPARRRSPRRSGETATGRARRSASFSPAATSISTCSRAGSSGRRGRR